MKNLIKSEFRKLFTVRSTYAVSAVVLLIISLFGVYLFMDGYKDFTGTDAAPLTDFIIKNIFLETAAIASLFLSIIAVLFVVHEYRYNMIMHSLTLSNSRLKVYGAKTLAILVFAAVFTIICGLFGVICYSLALAARDITLPAQNFDVLASLSKVLFYNLSYTIIGLVMAFLLRNIAGAIAFLLVFPTTVEPLLGLILKNNAAYLPFNALERAAAIRATEGMIPGNITSSAAIIAVAVYLIFGLAVSLYLFVRRDAN